MMSSKNIFFQEKLQKIQKQKQYAHLRSLFLFQKQYQNQLNAYPQDILDLKKLQYVQEKVISSVLKWGAGSMPERFLSKHLDYQKEIESALSQALGMGGSCLYDGTLLSLKEIFQCLVDKESVIFVDRFCHTPLLQAVKSTKALLFRFERTAPEQLEKLLEQHPEKKKFVILESISFFEGSPTPLKKYVELAKEYDAFLFVDETNAFGMYGQEGLGLVANRFEVDCIYCHFERSIGIPAACISSSPLIDKYLRNFCPIFKGLTPLSPALLSMIESSLHLIPNLQEEREHIQNMSDLLREKIQPPTWNFGGSSTYLVPLTHQDVNKVFVLAEKLMQNQIVTSVIVTSITKKLLVSIHASHTEQQIAEIAQFINNTN